MFSKDVSFAHKAFIYLIQCTAKIVQFDNNIWQKNYMDIFGKKYIYIYRDIFEKNRLYRHLKKKNYIDIFEKKYILTYLRKNYI